uniref:Uncharacterized protein n=1 Tax=Anguilla anguilla TaxID=7936 RepID=A0A0E9Q359_ANGAN
MSIYHKLITHTYIRHGQIGGHANMKSLGRTLGTCHQNSLNPQCIPASGILQEGCSKVNLSLKGEK